MDLKKKLSPEKFYTESLFLKGVWSKKIEKLYKTSLRSAQQQVSSIKKAPQCLVCYIGQHISHCVADYIFSFIFS